MLHIFLFVLFFALMCLSLDRIAFFKRAGINRKWLLGLFTLKVLAGVAIGWISYKFYPEGNDYWTLNQYGKEEYELLISSPGEFFSSLFHSPYQHYDGFFTSVGSYWNDLKNNIIIKFLAILNLVSRGNYYINSLFFSFISFFGHVALFRIFFSIFPERRILIIIGAFLLPSALYFSSGIHKDSFIFSALALYSWGLFHLAETFSWKRLWLLFLCAFFILFIRSHVFIVMIPATVAFLLARKRVMKHAFVITYALCIITVLALSFTESLNPVSILSNKQSDFFVLPEASSQLNTDTLQPTAAGLLKNTPQAIAHGFTEPLPWKFPNDPLMLLGIEMFLYLLFFLWWILNHSATSQHPVLCYCLAVAVPLLLFAGYIVPNAGSIVRYRAIYLPYLLLPLLCTVNRKHIRFRNI